MTDRRELAVLACGHACADFCQGAVPALVPFLVLRGGMDFKATGVLVLVMSVASSLLQPLIGARADRSSMAWAVPTGVALGGLGIAAVGVMDGFVPRVIAVAVAGLGVALFHPGGARRATRAAADRPGSGLGMFAVGGSIGFALAQVALYRGPRRAGHAADVLLEEVDHARHLDRLHAGEAVLDDEHEGAVLSGLNRHDRNRHDLRQADQNAVAIRWV